ncbi:threonine--tRNA ligase [Clostridium minihomine]|uniref:threonine--tRNA ligase n=1 Tax=Clostridium minihomine TaxID=2045012 RepID=UPI000C78C8D4|nr:threonine--tRNA ligase [Clostridium minihomine]
MIQITLKNDVKEFEAGITVGEVAKSLGAGLYKAACAGKVNGQVVDLRTPLQQDCQLDILTFQDPEGKQAYWHSTSHIMAQAVKRLFPEAKMAIGPSIEKGFYYDFDLPRTLTPEDLPVIEAEIKKIIKENLPIERFLLPPQEAIELMKEQDQPYKVELIEEHAGKGEDISFYRQGEFTDLCAGPHLMTTGSVKAVKLTAATSAYWRGDSKNKALQRVYGISFPKTAELEEYLAQVEEAKKRDHNVLGRQLEYFTTVDYIGQGLPIMLPKGARVLQTLQRFVEDTEKKRGYLLTKTPLMAKSDLYKISGHWDHYREGMFVMGDEEKDKEVFALRPMTCPFQYQVFLNRQRSYRDLPMRLGETSTLFRNEDSGEMHGLIRVRQFTISEGHLIVTPEQLEDEFRGCVELCRFMLETLGLAEDVSYRFSQWDPNNQEKYIGTPEQWDEAQSVMERILNHLGLEYSIGIDEAAFYGPKLDIQIRNVHGKEDTLITIQIDQMLAEKFGMEYVDRDGVKKNPYIIHRTSLGCYERTLALLLEKYAGALPMWLMPEQVRVLPISERLHDEADAIAAQLEEAGLEVSCDHRSEKIGYKIREAQLEKIPYMLVIGDKEVENGVVAVRSRREGDIGTMPLSDFIQKAVEEVKSKAR